MNPSLLKLTLERINKRVFYIAGSLEKIYYWTEESFGY